MYVVFHKDSTLFLRTWLMRNKMPIRGITLNTAFETASAAKAALTRAVKLTGINRNDFDWADMAFFHNEIEKKETRRGIAACEGQKFEVGVNTSWTCGPWSETYWSS